MNKDDEHLQTKLEALESGASLEQVLDAKDTETGALLRLAVSIRDLPHPELNPEPAQANFNSSLNASKSRTHPVKRPVITLEDNKSLLNWKNLKWALIPATAGLMLIALLAFITLFGLGTWLTGPRGAQAAVLDSVQGQVQVLSSGASPSWNPVEDGYRLTAGDQVRTLDDSFATLTFYDGSTASLGPNAEVVLVRVDGEWGGVLRIALIQTAGRSSHSVENLRGDRSFYIVYTPTSTASVRGTQFNVAVNPQGTSRFTVDRGEVFVSNDVSDVYLRPGQTTHAGADEEFTSPAYAFSLQGALSYKRGSTWAVSNVPFTVEEGALISSEPQIGDHVLVEGHLQADGSWIVDQVSQALSGDTQASFNNVVENIRSNSLQIGSWNLQVDENTQVLSDITHGEAVRVSFTTANNGQWVAQKVAPLQDGEDSDSTALTATPDPEAKPSLSFEPDELGSAGCQTEYSVTGTLWNTADEPKDYAANVLLDYQIIKGVEYVNSVGIDPNFWETILPGEYVDFDVTVGLDPDLWNEAPTGTEVKVRVFVAQETNRPGHHRTRLTVTLVSTCDEQETSTQTSTGTATTTPTVTLTPTATFTPTITQTPTPSQTPLPTTTGETNCTGAQPHPTGTKLATRYGVPYEEIMGWFCQGFGFGEIDLAYTLHQTSGWPVADIFNLKSSGMGWGNIKKMLDPKPTKVPPGKNK